MQLELHENKRPVKIPSLLKGVPNDVAWSRVNYVLAKHKELGYLQLENGTTPKWVQSEDPYDPKHLRMKTGDVSLDKLPDEGSPSLREFKDGKVVFVPIRLEICWMHVVEPSTGKKKKRYAKEWVADSEFTIPDLDKAPVKEGWIFRGWSYKGRPVNSSTKFKPEDAGGTIYADFLENF